MFQEQSPAVATTGTSTGTQTDPYMFTCPNCHTHQDRFRHNCATSSVAVATEDIVARAGLLNDHTYTCSTETRATALSVCHTAVVEDQSDNPTPPAGQELDTAVEPEDSSDPETTEPDSDYVPSSDDGDSSCDEDMLDDSDTVPSVYGDARFLCTEGQLSSLFTICHKSGCGKPVIAGPSFSYCGFALKVTTECIDGHEYTWQSQPKLKNTYADNILVPAALFVTGSSYETFCQFCDTLKVRRISARQFYNVQRAYIVPEVNSMWQCHIEGVMAAVGDTPLVVSGDARCDSPGYNATYGTYTVFDVDSGMIVAQETVKVTEVSNSYWLEPEGMKRCFNVLKDHNVKVEILATDRHPTISKVLKEDYPLVKHEYDLWHIVKGMKKRLLKTKDKELLPWVQAIANHMWYCAATCNGSKVLMKEKWLSILQHITNKHEWLSGQVMSKCDHDTYTEEEARTRPWLKPSSNAFQILQKTVLDKRLLGDLDKVTEGIHTGDLESIHGLYTKYAPKRNKFSYNGIRARLQLAALDHNTNTDRDLARTKQGRPRFKTQYSKATNSYVLKPIREGKESIFREELLKGVINSCLTTTSMRKSLERPTHSLPPGTEITIGEHRGLPKPDKEAILERHMSRFCSQKATSSFS